ncbi:MAG: cation-transporting P-type ATPase, partial [Bacillota bacterium]
MNNGNTAALEKELISRIHKLAPEDVYGALDTAEDGLSEHEAASRLNKYGKNLLQEKKGTPLILKFLSNFTHLMAILLWGAGIVALIAQIPELAIAIWMVNVINGAFSFWQEFRAGKATEALKKMLPDHVRVLRGGEEQQLLAENLVPGDVILLS